MASFEAAYNEDEDVLDVTFETNDEQLARTLALNDHVVLYTDPLLGSVWGLTFYSYHKLLLVSETEFTALKEIDPARAQVLLGLVARPPASLFFDITDPEAYIARIRAPRLDELMETQ